MDLKLISLSVGDFARPAPLRGSIEINSGLAQGAALGLEIHRQLQSERQREFANYQIEVPIEHSFEHGKYRFRICGRMDGFLPLQPARIEEIKSSFNTQELLRRLCSDPHHPYALQVRTYGYFHHRATGEVPELVLRLVSTRHGHEDELPIALDVKDYESWLSCRLHELELEAAHAEKRARRRLRIAKALRFPFDEPRPGQVELSQTIAEGLLAEQPMLIQAPTGLGKTVGVLFPVLREALGRAQRVIYVTPKNSQHSVAEEAIGRFREQGVKLKALTITAKHKICFKNEPICNPDFCEYAKDHYTKVARNRLVETLVKKRRLTERTFRALGKKHQVCPFELQWEAVTEADTVICDYNYVFGARSGGTRLGAGGLIEQGKPSLVIDEVHNLPFRAMDFYSPSLATRTLEQMRADGARLGKKFARSLEKLLQEGIEIIMRCRPAGANQARRIAPPHELFHEHDERLRAFLSRYVETASEILERDPVLRLSFYWSEFTTALERVSDDGEREFFVTFQPDGAGGALKITCCDPSSLLTKCYDEFAQVVGFSATLKPFSFYGKLTGLASPRLKTAEFLSPFPKSNRKLIIIPQISSKFSERERNFPRIAEVIHKIAGLKSGNYFAFFPSFTFLQQVWQRFEPPLGFRVIRQERTMTRKAINDVLQQLRDPDQPTLVFAVQGGVLAEGIDYPGRMLIGAFVVGPPLPTFDREREEMRAYYQKNYGAGFDYAYTYPAMAKAIQAAGRVIRSGTDEGLIVLMDNRFLDSSYTQSMPADWFEQSPAELVSSRILDEIRQFWARSDIRV